VADLILKFEGSALIKALSDLAGGISQGQVAAGPDVPASSGFLLQRSLFQYGTATTFSNGIILANDLYQAKKTIAGTSFVTIDLTGGSDKNYKGDALAFTAIKFVLLGVDQPDGTKAFRVGPQNQSNAWQGWFGGVGAQAYDLEYWWLAKTGPSAGWAVTAGSADQFVLYNPGATSIDVNIAIVGVR
jgi:hypothetical protein